MLHALMGIRLHGMEHVLSGVHVGWSNVSNGNAKNRSLKIASGNRKLKEAVHQFKVATQKEVGHLRLGILIFTSKQKMVVHAIHLENQKNTAQIANAKTATSSGVHGPNVPNSIPMKETAITTGK